MALLRVACVSLLVVCAATSASAQETSPSPKAVRVSFLPPPLEGTFSIGIYDASNRLVRVLQREAEVDDFTIEADALSTTWDGKNDAGEPLPPGKYRARGYAVATGDVEGVGYYFNDWVKDEQSLRITKMSALQAENELPVLTVAVNDGRTLTIMCDANGNIAATGERLPPAERCQTKAEPPHLIDPISCAKGRDETRWIIDRIAAGSPETEVKQFSRNQELLRRLSIGGDDPQPREIAVAKDADNIFLLEENGPVQRLRSLTLVANSSAASESTSSWKVDFEKKIVAHKEFNIAEGKPVISAGKAPTDRVTVKMAANPLKKDKRENLDLVVGFDADGSNLQTADGLPLASISDTHHLTRVVLASRNETSVDVFQDDEAVVEHFRMTGLDQIMSFDCGEIELK